MSRLPRALATETVSRLHHHAFRSWARLRHRSDFERVERFCLFVGYPRSEHSLVGALLNAHRHAVIAHELNVAPLVLRGCTRNDLYARLLAAAAWFDLVGNTSNYSYQVPGQWQGRFEVLRVIGDKRGGALTRCLAERPDLLPRVRALVGVPLRLIHVVRHPFDNIAAISLWQHLSLREAADFYFAHCDTTARLGELCGGDEVLTVRHEDMIQEPASALSRLCAFLGLQAEDDYLKDACGIVFESPSRTRGKVEWPAALVRDVTRRAKAYPFLEGAS